MMIKAAGFPPTARRGRRKSGGMSPGMGSRARQSINTGTGGMIMVCGKRLHKGEIDSDGYVWPECKLCNGDGDVVYIYGNHPDSPDGGKDYNVALCDVCFMIFRAWRRAGIIVKT